MAILLQFDYGKKLGLPNYSSHNFGVSMKAEVSDPEDIPQEAERAYRILQQAVDKQMENPGFLPSTRRENQDQTNETDPEKWNCTEKQRGLILKILSQNDLPESAVEEVAEELHGRSMSELGKMQVSTVISEVLDRWGKHKRTNGRAA
jgi:hypothetical protein